MPLDPSIILGFKSPQIDSPDEIQLKRANLQNVLQTNDINGLKLSEARNSIDRETNLRTLLSNTPEDQRVDTLTRAGYLDQADKLSKSNIERQNALTAQKTAKLTQAKAKNELIGQHMGFLKDNPTDENLKSTLNSLVQQGVMSAEEAQNAYANGPKDPEGIRALATQYFQSSVSTDKQLGQIIQQKLGGTNQVNQVNPVTGTVKTLSDTPVTVSPDTVANNDVKVSEGQKNRDNALTVAGMKDTTTGKVPPGYRTTPEGNLQAIPGGPADMKLAGAYNQDTAALGGAMNSFDRLATAANELLNHPGLGHITGLAGAVPNVPGYPGADAQAKLDTLKSQVGFGVLQDMRNNSKTGGALGAVSDAEGKRLEANLQSLDNKQSDKQMRENLKKIIQYTEDAKQRLRDAYNLKHGENGNQYTPSQSAKPKTAEDYLKAKGL